MRQWAHRTHPVVRDHLVAALHRAHGRFQHRATGISKPLSGFQMRLLADYAIAADFLHLAVGSVITQWRASKRAETKPSCVS